MNLSTIGIIAFFGSTALFAYAVQSRLVERRQIHRGLRSIRSGEHPVMELRRRELAVPLRQRVLLPGVRRIGRMGRRLTPAGTLSRLERLMSYSGSPVGWDAERLLASKLIAGVGLAMMGGLLALRADWAPLRELAVIGMFGLLGYYLPEFMIRSRAQRRQEAIRTALPDSLDLLSITVEAGLGFDSAIARVARQIGGPLGEELHRMVQEMQLGKSRGEALHDLSDRNRITELKSFVLAMMQADTFGISISRVLHIQAREMRTKRRQRAEERAQKVPVKIMMPLLFCIFPALFVVLLGPAAIRIYQTLF